MSHRIDRAVSAATASTEAEARGGTPHSPSHAMASPSATGVLVAEDEIAAPEAAASAAKLSLADVPQYVPEGAPSYPPGHSVNVAERAAPATPSGNSQPAPEKPPLDEPQRVRSAALVVLCLLAVMYTIYFARAVLLPLTFGLILALLLRPVVQRLSRARFPDAGAAAVPLFGVILVAVLSVYYLSAPAIGWLDSIPEATERIQFKLRPLQERFAGLSEATEKVEQLSDGRAPFKPLQVEVKQPSITSSFAILSVTSGYLASIGVAIVSAYFLLCYGDRLLANVLGLFPTLSAKRNVVELVNQVQGSVSGYLFTVTVINTCLGIAIGLAMWLLGLPNPALWGLMGAAFNYIPFAGGVAGCGVVFLVAILSFESLGRAALAPLVYFCLTALEGNIITPSLLGRSMSLNPIVVFLSLAFWGWMWGIGGALLAVPLLAVLKSALDQFESTRPLGSLLGA